MSAAEKKRRAHRYGVGAERLARLYLRCKGYRVLAGRHRNLLGEIDILAVKGDTLVAVEVKARAHIEDCAEAIAPWKQRRIIRALEGVLARGGKIAGLDPSRHPNIRFDAIWMAPGRWPQHIKDAWRA